MGLSFCLQRQRGGGGDCESGDGARGSLAQARAFGAEGGDGSVGDPRPLSQALASDAVLVQMYLLAIGAGVVVALDLLSRLGECPHR